MKPTLLVLAAGMATRYGSQKQTESFGPNGETIMDYSIYDAIKAGFGKVVFIIRKDFAEDFKARFDNRFNGQIEVDYAYQEMSAYVDTQYLPADRTKPWGTGHAMLCAADNVKEPFAVINADDYYGPDAFKKAVKFCVDECDKNTWAIIGYKLKNTLSENGSVSRGVCEVNTESDLEVITERTKIYRNDDGEIIYDDESGSHSLPEETSVSMNFWCFHQSAFEFIGKLFADFPKNNMDNLKAEFFIPIIGYEFIKEPENRIKVISTTAQWFGVTYKEDAPEVKANVEALVADGTYPASLWG